MKELIRKLNENGYEAYIVGGYVRDYLLGLSTTDIDICTNATVDEMDKVFEGIGKKDPAYFAYHIKDGEYSYDITTFRKELAYKKNKPVKIEAAPDLGTDLLRRDFTINTFAIDSNGLFVDVLGAKKDLNNRLIRVVGDTEKKLKEDRTRIIRAIRFACTLDFDLDSEIMEFFSKRKNQLLNDVPKEYKKKELDKIFDSNGAYKFFYILRRYGLAKHFNFNFGVVNTNTYNRYGVWSQLDTTLPLSKKEKSIIADIKTLINKKDIEFSDMKLYQDDVLYNAAYILGLQNKVRVFKEFMSLKSIIDIDASPDIFLKYVRYEDVKKVYRIVERNIMEGYLSNDSRSIEEFIKSCNYE